MSDADRKAAKKRARQVQQHTIRMDTMEESDKKREKRLRLLAWRRGYALRKDRARSWNYDHQGGYMIVNPSLGNAVVAGPRFDLNLNEVENWLKRDKAK